MSNLSTALHAIRPLSDEERILAAERARAVIVLSIGEKPRRDSFTDARISRYPSWFTRFIAVVMVVVFVAAAMPSLFRLFTAGRDYFTHGITDNVQAAIVGVSTFLLAEFLIILSTVSARVYFTGRSRIIFVIPIGLGLAMALVGNWVVAQPYDLFGWLETLVPPLSVLFLALIGERLVLDSIESRHAGEVAYGEALAQWTEATRDPESSPRWKSAYANALKAQIRESNSVGTGMKARGEIMAGLSTADWRALVIRELRADNWFDDLVLAQSEPPIANEEDTEEAPAANPT